MIKIKDVESKITPAKKHITISEVKFEGDILVDEEGNVIQRLKDAVGDDVDTFTLKINIEISDVEDDSDNEGTDE